MKRARVNLKKLRATQERNRRWPGSPRLLTRSRKRIGASPPPPPCIPLLSVCLSVCVSVSLLNFPLPSLPSLPLASPFKASPSAGFNPCPDNPARDNTSFYDWLPTCSSYLASVGIRGIFVDYRPGNEPARRKPRCPGPSPLSRLEPKGSEGAGVNDYSFSCSS